MSANINLPLNELLALDKTSNICDKKFVYQKNLEKFLLLYGYQNL